MFPAQVGIPLPERSNADNLRTHIMYLTQFPINVSRRETYKMLASPHRMHAAIEASFPLANDDNQEGRTLWRYDTVGHQKMLYILSQNKPSLVGLDEQIGWPDLEQQWKTLDYTPLLNQLENGQTYRFRLVANPVITHHHQRIPHLTATQQMAWLAGNDVFTAAHRPIPDRLKNHTQSRAERNGFQILKNNDESFKLTISNMHTKRYKHGNQNHNITLASAQYDGILTVTDKTLMRHVLTNGLGHGKAFGCGLMTIVPCKASHA